MITLLSLCCIMDFTSVLSGYSHLDEDEIGVIVESVVENGQKKNISPLLLFSILHVESHFGKYNRSLTNDYGPMQINKFWLKYFGITEKDVMSWRGALKYGSKILAIKRQEVGSRGCWWSVYNSRKKKYRQKYEYSIRRFIEKRLNMRFDCSNGYMNSWKSGLAGLRQKLLTENL